MMMFTGLKCWFVVVFKLSNGLQLELMLCVYNGVMRECKAEMVFVAAEIKKWNRLL